MENIILIVLKALGSLGETGVHWVLRKIEAFVTLSTTEIDNSIFYKVINYIKSYQFQSPPTE